MSLWNGLKMARRAITGRFLGTPYDLSMFAPSTFGSLRIMSGGTFMDVKEVTERVLSVVKNFEKVDPAKVTPEADFSKDLGLDSLDTVEVVMAFEEEFCVEIPDAEADRILSTSDAIKYISGHPQAK